MDGACAWAYERIQTADFIVLDTETTDLRGEVIDLAIIDAAGRVQEPPVRSQGSVETDPGY
jgi:hypothetical protein